MINLTFIDGTDMKIDYKGKVVFLGEGSEAIKFMTNELAICKKELFTAMQICADNGDDSMHFGITGGFIYSETKGA